MTLLSVMPAAVAIVDAVTADPPPLRLVLGADAIDAIRASLTDRLRDLVAWRS